MALPHGVLVLVQRPHTPRGFICRGPLTQLLPTPRGVGVNSRQEYRLAMLRMAEVAGLNGLRGTLRHRCAASAVDPPHSLALGCELQTGYVWSRQLRCPGRLSDSFLSFGKRLDMNRKRLDMMRALS
jgi:hypothetical protein